jgi:3-hydroxyisobutyrate dehydrogenase-like beta-hydroxyacid dehydrogenase
MRPGHDALTQNEPEKEDAHIDKQVGFIGLGIMGTPMARNLIKCGFQVTVFNRTASKAERLAMEGAIKADSIKELAKNNLIVITMVSDTPDV